MDERTTVVAFLEYMARIIRTNDAAWSKFQAALTAAPEPEAPPAAAADDGYAAFHQTFLERLAAEFPAASVPNAGVTRQLYDKAGGAADAVEVYLLVLRNIERNKAPEYSGHAWGLLRSQSTFADMRAEAEQVRRRLAAPHLSPAEAEAERRRDNTRLAAAPPPTKAPSLAERIRAAALERRQAEYGL